MNCRTPYEPVVEDERDRQDLARAVAADIVDPPQKAQHGADLRQLLAVVGIGHIDGFTGRSAVAGDAALVDGQAERLDVQPRLDPGHDFLARQVGFIQCHAVCTHQFAQLLHHVDLPELHLVGRMDPVGDLMQLFQEQHAVDDGVKLVGIRGGHGVGRKAKVQLHSDRAQAPCRWGDSLGAR